MQNDTMIVSLTVGELSLLISEQVKAELELFRQQPPKKVEFLKGFQELADFLHASISAVYQLKKSGVLDSAIIYPSKRRFLINVEKLNELLATNPHLAKYEQKRKTKGE